MALSAWLAFGNIHEGLPYHWQLYPGHRNLGYRYRPASAWLWCSVRHQPWILQSVYLLHRTHLGLAWHPWQFPLDRSLRFRSIEHKCHPPKDGWRNSGWSHNTIPTLPYQLNQPGSWQTQIQACAFWVPFVIPVEQIEAAFRCVLLHR